MRYIGRVALGLAVVMLLAACGAGSSAGGEDTSRTYEFTATDLAGQTVRGQDLADTPTVLWFWAPWCPTCRAQAPTVTALARQYEGKVDFVGVGGLARVEDIRDYAKQLTGLTVLIDEEGAVWRHFRVTAQSTYVVIDKSGTIVSEGYLDNGDLTEKVGAL